MTGVGAAAVAAASLVSSTLPHLLLRPPLPSPVLPLGQLRFRSLTAAPPLSSPRRIGLRLAPLSASRRGQQRREEVEFEDDGGWSEEEDGDDTEVIPFREMRRWLENKPAGFGDGKFYDTRVEDEIWEEMERGRRAHLAAINKAKNESGGTKNKKKQKLLPKAAVEESYGPRVRIRNLPRKKNIHRDLQRAFKGFPGLASISPAVLGNEKTRDPICKGFAFLDFESEEAAHKFVQVYSRRSLCFGKLEKQIACDVVNPSGSFNSAKLSDDNDDDSVKTQVEFKNVGLELHKASEVDIITSQDRTFDDESISIRLIGESEAELFVENDNPSTHIEETVNGEMVLQGLGSTKIVNPVQKKQQKKAVSKKKAVKTYSMKPSKPSLPGSAARLNIKERTVLNGVFSKYSKDVAAAES